MTIKGKAYIVGAYEHPLRKAPDHSVAQLHAEVAKGALEDAGLTKDDIDGYFCAGDAPGVERLEHGELHEPDEAAATSTRPTWAAARISSTSRTPREAIAAGKCNVALITLAGRPQLRRELRARRSAAAASTCPTRRSRCRTAR